MRSVLQLLAFLVLALAGPQPLARAAAGSDTKVPVGSPLRAATLQGLNAPAVPLASFRGKPVLINVLASWCEPYRAEMASLERLAWGPLAHRFTIIGISTDDDRALALAWLARSNATISHYLDHQLEMEHMLGATHIPLTVLVDAEGRVLRRIYGAREWDSAESVALIERVFWPRGTGLSGVSRSAPCQKIDSACAVGR
jgi:thiol-disulfide isomerase/thioredoxin